MYPQIPRRWSPLFTLPLLNILLVSVTIPQPVVSQGVAGEKVAETCSNNFYLMEENILSNTKNRFELLKTFYSSKEVFPVFVKVNYTFVNHSNSTVEASELWYWSMSEFYFIQPLEIFQYTSLFFSNFEYRKSSLVIELSVECANASHDKMEMLTQRLQLYAQSATTSTDADTRKISADYAAVAASHEDIENDSIQSDFVKVWLHLFLVLFPIGSAVMLYLCDPIQLLLGEKMRQALEDENNHPTIAALIQVSVIFTTFVLLMDMMGVIATIRSDFLSYDKHSAFYLSVVTGNIFDIVAFVWVMYVLATSCHWDFKNMWQRWRRQSCKAGGSERIKKLMCTIMFAPALCVANHVHYIILAWIADPYHAGSLSIFYFITFILYYIIFRQVYARMVLQKNNGGHSDSAHPSLNSYGSDSTGSLTAHGAPRVAFNTQAVVLSLFLLGPVLILYEATFIILFAALPITKTLEASPTLIYSIYQGTGLLIVALLTYSIILQPSGFSLAKAIEKVAKKFHVPDKVSGWNKMCDEEKCAHVVKALCEKSAMSPIPLDVLSRSDNSVTNHVPETIV